MSGEGLPAPAPGWTEAQRAAWWDLVTYLDTGHGLWRALWAAVRGIGWLIWPPHPDDLTTSPIEPEPEEDR